MRMSMGMVLSRRGGGNPFARYVAGDETPEVVADPLNGFYAKASASDSFANVMSFARTGTANKLNSSGAWTSVADGAARTGHHLSNGITFLNEGLLLETDASTQEFIYTKDFSQSAWTKTGVAAPSQDAEDSAGTANSATTLQDDGTGGSGNVRLQESHAFASGGDQAITVRAKAGELKWMYILELLYDAGTNYTYFDIENGNLGNVDVAHRAYITPAGNGFFDCTLIITTSTDLSGAICVGMGEANGTASANKDGTSSIILESITTNQSSMPPSHSDSSGTATTRNAESLSIPAANTSPSTSSLSLYYEGVISRKAGTAMTLLEWAADASNKIVVGVNASDQAYVSHTLSGTTVTVTGNKVLSPSGTVAWVPISLAVRCSSSAVNIAVNGVAASASATAGIPDLSSADIDFTGPVVLREFRLWEGADLGDSVCASVSLPDVYLFLVAGQSNAIGRATYDNGLPHPLRSFQWKQDDSMGVAGNPLDHVTPSAGDFGLDVTFAREFITANPRVQICFVPCADGSSGFDPASAEWNEGDVNYNNAVAQANDAIAYLGTGLTAMLWHQGETDAYFSATQSEYETNFDAMVTAMRGDITGASSMPVVVGEIGAFLDTGTYPTRDDIIAAQVDTPNRVSSSAVVTTSDLTDDDGVHFDAASLRTMGSRYYTAWVSL